MKNFKKMIPFTLNIICLINPLSSVYANGDLSSVQGETVESILPSPEYLANIIKYPILCRDSSCIKDIILANFKATNNFSDLKKILEAYKLMIQDTSSLSNNKASLQDKDKELSEAISLINSTIALFEQLASTGLANPYFIMEPFLSATFDKAEEFVLKYFQKPSLSPQEFNNTRQDSKSRSTATAPVETPVNFEFNSEQEDAIKRLKKIHAKGQNANPQELEELNSIGALLNALPHEVLNQIYSDLREIKVTNPWNVTFSDILTK